MPVGKLAMLYTDIVSQSRTTPKRIQVTSYSVVCMNGDAVTGTDGVASRLCYGGEWYGVQLLADTDTAAPQPQESEVVLSVAVLGSLLGATLLALVGVTIAACVLHWISRRKERETYSRQILE